MSLLVTSDCLLTLPMLLTADDKYSHHFTKNLAQPIQMQLSKKPNPSSQIFIEFLKST